MRRAAAMALVLATASVAVSQTTRPVDPDDRAAVAAVMGPPNWNAAAARSAAARLHAAADRLRPLLEPYWADADRDPDRAAAAYLLYLMATGDEPPHAERLAGVGHFRVTITGPDAKDAAGFCKALKVIPPTLPTASWVGRVRGVPTALLAVDGVARHRQLIDGLAGDHTLVVTDDTLFARAEYDEFLRDRGKAAPAAYAATFRQLYGHLGRTYPNFQMKGIDWPAVGDELLPRSERVTTDRTFGLLVLELVARLQDSHAVVRSGTVEVPDPGLPAWDPGFACLTDDRGHPTVYAVEPDSPAAWAGVRPGATVVAFGNVAADRLVADRATLLSRYYGYSSDRTLRYDAVRSFASQSRRGAVAHLALVDPAGRPSTLDLPCDCGPRYLPRLPVPRPRVADSADCSWTTVEPDVGYVYVRRIGTTLTDDLDAAVRALGPVRGLVIDVRGNSGGGFDADAAFANFDPDERRWSGRPRYAGPIAVLVDERTISAAEGWTSWFVAHHRARLFGTTSAGASSRKEEYALADGRFSVVVPVKPYTGFLDRPIERRGLEPDVAVRCSAADLSAGRDTVVEAAVGWLRGATTRP